MVKTMKVPSRVTKSALLFLLTVLAIFICVGMNSYLRYLPGIKLLNLSSYQQHNSMLDLVSRYDHASVRQQNLTEVFAKRRNNILEVCKTKASEWRGDGSVKRLVISKRYKLAYCPVPKIASTFWSNLILENRLSDEPTNHHDRLEDILEGNKSTLHLRNLQFDTGYWFMKHYKSILFVRDPYSRLLAAYIDKFFSPNPIYWKVGQFIIKRYRKDADQVSERCGQNVKFTEFIKFVISDIKHGHSDQHWKPIYKRCSPCQLEYDIISKLETVSTEGEYIINKYIPRASFKNMVKETAFIRLNMNVDNFFRFFQPSMRFCMPFPEALQRLLKKLQVRGVIDKTIDLPREWKLLYTVTHKAVKNFMHDAVQRSASNPNLSVQRKEALIEAFQSIPLDDLKEIRDLYQPDFKLFGYDPEPEYLFKTSEQNAKYSFFQI